MDKKKLQLLAGIITESSTIEFHKKTMGQLGTIAVIEGDAATFIAKLLRVKDDWKLVKSGDGWCAYDGERLTFFDNKLDYTDDNVEF